MASNGDWLLLTSVLMALLCLALGLTGLGGVQALPSSFCSPRHCYVCSTVSSYLMFICLYEQIPLWQVTVYVMPVFNTKQGIIYESNVLMS